MKKLPFVFVTLVLVLVLVLTLVYCKNIRNKDKAFVIEADTVTLSGGIHADFDRISDGGKIVIEGKDFKLTLEKKVSKKSTKNLWPVVSGLMRVRTRVRM
jgi:preprotein translocase subunit YajC